MEAEGDAPVSDRMVSMTVGVVVRRTPGVTRWAKWAWRAVAVLPGAGPADWKELRRDGDAVEFHAATLEMELWRTDTEAYLVAISNEPPSVYVVMRRREDPASPHEMEIVRVTASPYEAQDFADTGEDIVEPVPAPEGLVAFIRDFVERHHVEEAFVKRRRDRARVDRKEDGKGDPRIRQDADVYRAPGSRKGVLH